ncbi:hypothetical protein EK0264_12655 [Epidermidibacterium keratini]|uniref:histidine kinase n=1 Tax=Epidermidibacterium keratini TaxID=1891644 RepID=A0A7L4YR67_9ACTN|nr:histidine kinase [Epidermidibacterium keratini]QHC01057.1 hypothetical protein EK0264_12655 [Epidermidibacterium keratini]
MLTTTPQRSDWLRRHPAVGDTALFAIAAVLLGWPSVAMTLAGAIPVGWRVVVLAALAILHAIPLTRRRWPVATYAAASVAMALLCYAPHVPYQGAVAPAVMMPSVLLYFLALYEICASKPAPVANFAAGVALVGGALVIARLTADDSWMANTAAITSSWPILTAIAVGGVLASWGLGRLRRTREEFQRGLEVRAALDERRRIAREMHDVVSHSLAVMVAQAEGGRMSAPDDQSRRAFGAIGEAGRSALDDMRGLLGVLRSDERTEREPAPSVQQVRLLAESTSDAGLPTSYGESGRLPDVPAGTSLSVYRIVQEALTNAMKHAGPDARVDVELHGAEHEIRLSVRTLGMRSTNARTGGGTRSMHERAQAAGGQLSSGPTPDGWLVEAHLPTRQAR